MRSWHLAAVSALIIFGAGSAQATTSVVDGHCPNLTAGCLFSGNINSGETGPNSYHATETAFNDNYNDTHPSAGPDIALDILFSSDDAGFTGTLTGAGGSSGTWSLPGYLVSYVAVKAADSFVLYSVSPASSGNWDTLLIPYHNNPHDLSHLVFFGTRDSVPSVPEPASWALMLGGFGAIGAAMRGRRKAAVSFS